MIVEMAMDLKHCIQMKVTLAPVAPVAPVASAPSTLTGLLVTVTIIMKQKKQAVMRNPKIQMIPSPASLTLTHQKMRDAGMQAFSLILVTLLEH